jgi:hypothetical protein
MTPTSTDSELRWHRIAPTPSYSIELPDDCAEDIDGSVLSYWRADDSTVLQISSYRRNSGELVTARERLAARVARGGQPALSSIDLPLPYPDHAVAIGTDDEQVTWLYVYIAWQKVTLLVTLSGRRTDLLNPRSWSRRALASIRPAA